MRSALLTFYIFEHFSASFFQAVVLFSLSAHQKPLRALFPHSFIVHPLICVFPLPNLKKELYRLRPVNGCSGSHSALRYKVRAQLLLNL